MKFVRLAGSTLLALLTSGIFVMVVQAVSNRLYPLPEGIDTTDLEALKKHISTLPAGAFGLVLLSYVAGTTAGSWAGVRSPLFMAACVAVFPISGSFGIRLGRRS